MFAYEICRYLDDTVRITRGGDDSLFIFCREPGERPMLTASERKVLYHPGGNPGANLKSISHRCYLFEVAFAWELTKETIHLPLGCLQGGHQRRACSRSS